MPDGIKICRDLSEKQHDYCVSLAQSCNEQHDAGKKEIVLDLMNGRTVYFNDPEECRSFAMFRASVGAPKGFISRRRPAAIRTITASDEIPEPADTSHPAFKKCAEFSSPGSSAFKYCQMLLGICTSESRGPYYLRYAGGKAKVEDQDECISLALFYAELAGSSDSTASGASTREEEVWKPDGETSFASSFSNAGFSPEKTDKLHVKALTLLFNHDSEIRGMKINIAYRTAHVSGDTWSINYRIFRDKAPKEVSEDMLDNSFNFRVDDDRITDVLAFGVTLESVGDFGNVAAMEIVKLK